MRIFAQETGQTHRDYATKNATQHPPYRREEEQQHRETLLYIR